MLTEATLQPYIWVDVKPSDYDGEQLLLIVGNSGPSTATNVRVEFSPEIRGSGQYVDQMHAKLASGISSLAPGRIMKWNLGEPAELVVTDPQATDVSIDFEGPFGAVDTVRYRIDMNDFRESLRDAQGTLRTVTAAIDKLEKSVRTRKEIQVKLMNQDDDRVRGGGQVLLVV